MRKCGLTLPAVLSKVTLTVVLPPDASVAASTDM